MHDYAVKHQINKSWLHFGHLDSRYDETLMDKYELKKLPVLLHFYEGELIKKDYRFHMKLNAEKDLDIKFLHTICDMHPSHEEFLEGLKDALYTIVIDVH